MTKHKPTLVADDFGRRISRCSCGWEPAEEEQDTEEAFADHVALSYLAIRPSLPPLPMQPVVLDPRGVIRFRGNKIVEYIVDNAARVVATGCHAGRLDLNKLAMMSFPQEDREQFAQLMGYSISGYHELSYVSDESAEAASVLARAINPKSGGCRDEGCPFHGGKGE